MNWQVSLMALAACALAAVGRSLESGVWQGHVSFGPGGSSFRPCRSREMWWLKGRGYDDADKVLEARYHEIAERPYEQIFVRVSGEVSKKGQYGPLGTYQRVLYLEEILEIRPQQEDDCRKKKK